MSTNLYAKGESVHGPRVVAYLWGHGNYEYSIQHIECAADLIHDHREIDVVKINGSYETAMEIFEGEIMPDTYVELNSTGVLV
tara:strand:+ start:212 stop:460 length:249 start_codon:yes stop_codon:yes gene_type:complete